jgi:hypothetical protein
MTGNNINLNAQNTLLNQSGDITAVNNLNLKAKTITNIASEQTITVMLVSSCEVIVPLLTIVPLLLMVMFCALKKARGVLLKSSSVALAK